MERPHHVFIVGLLLAVGLHILIGKYFYEKIHSLWIPVIICMGGMLQVYSYTWWPYLLVPVIGVLSKSLLTYRGRHIFNPSNLGIVIMVELFPHHLITSTNLFSSYIFVSIIFFLIGTLNVLYAKQHVVAFSWLVGFCIFNYARTVFIEGSHFNFALQVFNPLIMLFTFHMITDPATVPKTTRLKICFGLLIAAIDCFMRIQRMPNSNYYALILCSSLLPFIWNFEDEKRFFLQKPSFGLQGS